MAQPGHLFFSVTGPVRRPDPKDFIKVSVVKDVQIYIAAYAVYVSRAACLPEDVRALVVGLVDVVGGPSRPCVRVVPDLFS